MSIATILQRVSWYKAYIDAVAFATLSLAKARGGGNSNSCSLSFVVVVIPFMSSISFRVDEIAVDFRSQGEDA